MRIQDHIRKSRRAALPILAVVASLTAAACGSDESGSGDGPQAVTVGLVPVAGSAPVQIALDEGFFKKEGLDVTIKPIQGPAATAALLNGETQFASLGASVVVTAASQGAPLTIISGRTETAETADQDEQGIMVMPKSGIKDVADLSGKTVATVTLGSISTLLARATVKARGGDASTIKFVEIPFPEMTAALKSGSVDAAAVAEPFMTPMQDEGVKKLFGFGADAFDQSVPLGVIGATKQFAQENPEAVAAFQRAMASAIEWAREDEQRLREALVEITDVSEDVAKRMILPTFTAEVSEGGLELLTEELVAQGAVEKPVEASEILR